MKYKTYSPTESEMRTELASLRRQLAEAEQLLAASREANQLLVSDCAQVEQDARRWSLFSKWWFRYWKDGNWEDAISAAKTPKELVDAIDAAIATGEVAGGS